MKQEIKGYYVVIGYSDGPEKLSGRAIRIPLKLTSEQIEDVRRVCRAELGQVVTGIEGYFLAECIWVRR